MAEISVNVVNNSGRTIGLRLEEGGEEHEYLKTLVRRDDLHSITVVDGPAAGREPDPEAPATPPDPEPGAGAERDSGRPAVNDPKSEWISYVVSRGKLSADDAANYTKADLIDLAS